MRSEMSQPMLLSDSNDVDSSQARALMLLVFLLLD